MTESPVERHPSREGYACGQEVQGPLRGRELNLFKNVWDLAIYQRLLLEVRPRSIIEPGSGTGAGALWLSPIRHGRPPPITGKVEMPSHAAAVLTASTNRPASGMERTTSSNSPPELARSSSRCTPGRLRLADTSWRGPP
ncbi:Cephalosporin hydroxylase [Streptosporangium canum]|uniref:Cephalosporin hydroxylase n=1 Tax=Streptosporangium canum TaxID=324952 RepID=A0A1I3GNP7_9ACTN|nr:Cephalosporin hydroxylase [Streptosporangium canum]